MEAEEEGSREDVSEEKRAVSAILSVRGVRGVLLRSSFQGFLSVGDGVEWRVWVAEDWDREEEWGENMNRLRAEHVTEMEQYVIHTSASFYGAGRPERQRWHTPPRCLEFRWPQMIIPPLSPVS